MIITKLITDQSFTTKLHSPLSKTWQLFAQYTTDEKKQIRLLHPSEMAETASPPAPLFFFFCSVCISVLESGKEALPVKAGDVVEAASWELGRKGIFPDTHWQAQRKENILPSHANSAKESLLAQQSPYPSLFKKKDIQICLGKRSHDFVHECAKHPLNFTLLYYDFLICSKDL